MSDLAEDVERSFRTISQSTGEPEQVMGPVATFTMKMDAVPGLGAMRSKNEDQIKSALRRAYRYYAGVPLPKSHDETFALTREKLGTLFSALVIETFCDGIQVGQGTEHAVKFAIFKDSLGELFATEEFQAASMALALKITHDPEVMEFFTRYTIGSATALSHACGFAHGEDMSHKIWDLWLMAATSMITAGYIAGYQLGGLWTERDLVAEMEADMEESDDGSE